MTSNSLSLIVLLSAFLLVLLHYFFFLNRILRGLNNLTLTANEKLPYEFVSIIIPFRNEKENILASLKSIESQFYPEDKYEVIYLDDFSEENSLELLKNNIKKNNIRVLTVPNDFSTNAHKKRAVRYGIENAKGNIIVLPDGRVVVHHAVAIGPAESATTAPPNDVLASRPLSVVETPARGRLVESPGSRWSHVMVPIIS